ncbi:MAG: hypothetical protein A3H91_03555 [Gammaproteobacteria bacterium RIFCSPLOWO2_02_FULL_61_13]|nr:MAG: hypothetical protein A3H91_03555 [Gammaproteobacteria bacterium RIFCSPLOWO2_02_FULL_61_13]
MMHVFATLIFSLVGGTAAAQQLGGGIFAYPDAGQSQKQQQKDQMECHQWATGQTGIDPARNRPPQTGQGYSSSYSSSSGSGFGSREVGEGGMVGDAARGAAFGAMFGAIAGDAGQGAAIGAASGTLFGGMKRSSRKAEEQRWQQQQQAQARQQQQQAQQQYYFALDNFQRAYGTCMSSRKYRVQ